jgi:small conductance mechanosensitive channel
VGDIAIINGTAGLVQEIRLRTTVLRAVDGTVHVFQNGSINTLSNMTKDYSYFVLDLPVAYKEDTDRVCRVVSELGAEMQTDATFKPLILEPAEILGVEEFKESSLIIKLRIKTMPTRQFDVGREFRRRLKYRFDQEGIEIPTSKPFLLTPSSLVTQVPASGPAETGSASAP